MDKRFVPGVHQPLLVKDLGRNEQREEGVVNCAAHQVLSVGQVRTKK